VRGFQKHFLLFNIKFMNRPKFDFNQWLFWLDLTSIKVRKFQVKAIKMGKYGYEYSGDDNDIVNDIVPEQILRTERQQAINFTIEELISSLEDDAVTGTTDNRSDGGC
jgi:hypothetical protein